MIQSDIQFQYFATNWVRFSSSMISTFFYSWFGNFLLKLIYNSTFFARWDLIRLGGHSIFSIIPVQTVSMQNGIRFYFKKVFEIEFILKWNLWIVQVVLKYLALKINCNQWKRVQMQEREKKNQKSYSISLQRPMNSPSSTIFIAERVINCIAVNKSA